RIAAIFYRFDCLHQQTACDDDGPVGRPQVLLAAIHNGAHALLHPTILGVDALDTGERLGLLHLSINQPAIASVDLRAEGTRIDVVRAISGSTCQSAPVAEPC